MRLEAFAKVNLSLEVYAKRPDGYHDLRSVVLPVALSDTVDVEVRGDGLVTTDTAYGENDLAVKAALALRESASVSASRGADIRIRKRIFAGGGLGGGSADAAAVLRALNVLWGAGMPVEELAAVGARVGSDVPALVLAQHFLRPVLMEGRGEKVAVAGLDVLQGFGIGDSMVLANPGVHSSTAEVYARCVPRRGRPAGPVNDLQEAACAMHPGIAAALSALSAAGASGVMMSGSGATVFGFAESECEAAKIAAAMAKAGFAAVATRPAGSVKQTDFRWASCPQKMV